LHIIALAFIAEPNYLNMKYSILFLVSFFSLSMSYAQNDDISPKLSSPILETIHSDIVNFDYNIFVTLPTNYTPKEKTYQVLYYLDAWTKTDVLNAAALHQTDQKQINPVILVGISYNTNFEGRSPIRTRDYVPGLKSNDTLHRADNFLQFIKTELIPYIDGKYATKVNDRGLLGFSYGGLFCAWVLKQEPELFQKMGIISPSLWYEEKALFKDEELLNNIKKAKNLNLLIACGSLESDNMRSNSKQLFDLLNANQNIKVSNIVFEDENHSTVSIVAYNRALTYFYRNQYAVYIDKAFELFAEKNYEKSIENILNAFQYDPEQITLRNRYGLATLYALLENKDGAFKQLDIISELKNYDFYEHIVNDKSFESLRSDKRWVELIDFYKKLKE